MIIALKKYDNVGEKIIKMDEIRKNQISEKAKEILSENNIDSYDFNVLKMISENYGFSLDVRNFKDPRVTGTLLVDDERTVVAGINKLISISSNVAMGAEAIQRIRFIALHELGHYLLHKKDSKQFAMRDTDFKDSEEEQEADYFALCMLMPEDKVTNLFGDSIALDEEKIQLTKKVFGVTNKKARMRLQELDLIGNNE